MKKNKSKQWTTEEIEKEIEELKPKNREEMISQGMKPPRFKKGRPEKLQTVKTNLDLTIELISELDSIAGFMGSNRQAVIKHFIINGLSDHYKSRSLKDDKKRA